MSSALNRIEEKLKNSIKNSNFYEAHQLYTTLYHRYNSKQRYRDARIMLVKGAEYLFANKQVGSGAQLSLLYVESLEKNVDEVNDEIIITLDRLLRLMPRDLVEMDTFQKRALLWSAKCKDAPKTGNRILRRVFGVTYWNRKMYEEARQHFLYADGSEEFGDMLADLASNHGLPCEADMFLAQVVLQLLCLKRIKYANDVFNAYIAHHPKLRNVPDFTYPLINFCGFLLMTIKLNRLDAFTVICDKYHTSLKRDVLYFGYLERITENFFGVASIKRKQKPGFLENLVQSLFDDDESEGKKQGSSSKALTVEDLD